MPNAMPYLVLIAICAIASSVLLVHKRAAWPLILLLSFSGMIYVFEFYIFVLKDCYRYSPHLLAIPYYDNVLGAVFSNLLSVPVAALFIAVYRLSWRWIVGLSLAYGGVEWLFLQLGIYQHHWWRTGYTILALILFFRFARQWLVWLAERGRAFRFVTLLMFAWSVVATVVFTLAVTGIRVFHSGYFQDPYRDDIFLSAMYGFFKAAVISVTVTATRHHWRRLISLAVILAANLVLMKLGILRVRIPLWQYWLIYGPCCLLVLWLVAVGNRKLEQFRMNH
ncbi:hypothetical protein I8J29_05240 [Paenibacillus sp. MWE-103]|uniref:Uncharacterized protein n=1 Tax=Paenibacillus artemisiicola TaxID=1172618 RepID=A0ABS3W5K0_9BACL|nr:hypothetical protein [Paenibacillus artemisiicola]MBO7743589.1 hypothetical protein [Paenibacillus artemisiicola]